MALVSNFPQILQQIDKLQTHYDVFKFLKEVSYSFGFEKFLLCNMPKLDETISEKVVLTNWDQEMVQSFDEAEVSSSGGYWVQLRSTILPVPIVANIAQSLQPKFSEAEILLSFGYRRTVYYPMVQPDGARWIFAFCDSSEVRDTDAEANLHLVLMHLSEKMASFETTKTEAKATLSDREKDCLKWTANGKTSGEIASILSLSEHTVNHYLMNATRKLQAVTRTQAVVNAMRIGMIH